MEPIAIIVMIGSMLMLWGGFILSIRHAMKKGKK